MDILQILFHSLVDDIRIISRFKKKKPMNIFVCVFVFILFSWIATRPRVEWLGHMVCVCLTLETAKLFPGVIVPVYFYTSSMGVQISFSTSFPTLTMISLTHVRYSNRYLWHRNCNLYLPNY